jgi:hypothetical protein
MALLSKWLFFIVPITAQVTHLSSSHPRQHAFVAFGRKLCSFSIWKRCEQRPWPAQSQTTSRRRVATKKNYRGPGGRPGGVGVIKELGRYNPTMGVSTKSHGNFKELPCFKQRDDFDQQQGAFNQRLVWTPLPKEKHWTWCLATSSQCIHRDSCRNEIFTDFPIKKWACSPCPRSEQEGNLPSLLQVCLPLQRPVSFIEQRLDWGMGEILWVTNRSDSFLGFTQKTEPDDIRWYTLVN